MAIVENNIVKMEWEKSGWLATKGRGGSQGAFIFASKDYQSARGCTISVFFTSDTAFIWANDAHTADEDIWNSADLKDWCKSNLDGSFPHQYDEYVAVIDSGEMTANDEILEEYGLMEFKADIEARMRDIAPFGDEKIIEM